ncbi:MAG TPA: sugar ABC transporter permease [Thermomicrobiales bacterium]|nr:sugar ABC transporter permease [Thermomicrobiales bacterium]
MAVTTGEQPVSQTAAPQKRTGFLNRLTATPGEMGRHWADYLYILPAIGIMLLVIAYPVFYTVRLSFYNTPANLAMSDKVWVGLDNYKRILQSDAFREVTSNTLEWTILSTFFAFIIGFGAALVIQREFPGRSLVRGLLLIPWVISYVSAAYIWKWLYNSDYGLINDFLLRAHIIDENINILDNVHRALPALIVANIWKEFPFAMIMMLAGLQGVPDQLHRAALVDGAGVWARFWHITVPQLKSVSIVTVLLLTLTNLNSFTLVWIMTGGGPAGATDIWITQIYQLAFGRTRFGVASAYSVILFLCMMSVGYFYVKALTRGDERREAA